jgi:RNA polymerase sigma-70 factor (ECF subfamily)
VVLTAISLIFTEGHTSTSGDQLVRTDLSSEAIRLARLLVELMPDEAEAVGLLALMLLTDARRSARLDAHGSIVRLADHDRTLWNTELIAEGQRLVRSCLRRNQPGPFQIQAAIAAVHADAPTADATDWAQIVTLYDQLYEQNPNPVVTLNRAIAISELLGLAEGLAALDALDANRLAEYQPYHATRADLLARSGRTSEAIDAYNRAIELTTNPTEHRFLTKQRAHAANSSRAR